MCTNQKSRLRRLTALGLVCILIFFSLPVTLADETEPTVHTLYIRPSTASESCGTIVNGDAVTLLDTVNETWSRIRLADGTTGYCHGSLLGVFSMTSESDADPIPSVVRTGKAVTVLQSPHLDADIIVRLPDHAPVNIVGLGVDGFQLILLGKGKMGYVPEEDLIFQYEQPALVRTVPELFPDGATTEEEAALRLQELSAYFQHGLYWNCAGTGLSSSKKNLFVVTETPCKHSSRGYQSCNIYTGALCKASPGYSVAMQCFGYANLLSDLVFGTDAPVYTHNDFEKLRVGDHVRLVLWDHSMVVTEVCKDENGKTYVYVTDVNADYENCKIQWGRKFTQDELRRLGDYIRVHTRYPLE